jgi:hypothetical protein
MMRQYRQIRAGLPEGVILFFLLGDFYEMFFEDAKTAAPVLDVALTRRNGVPMCGVPFHAVDNYVARLLRAGKKVAICEQMEDPAILVQRSEVLDALSRAGCAVVVAPIQAVMERLASPDAYATSSIRIELNQNIDPEALWEQLLDQGYKPVAFVDEPGEIARRGGSVVVNDLGGEVSGGGGSTSYADAVVESLTKFASGHADVMGGITHHEGRGRVEIKRCADLQDHLGARLRYRLIGTARSGKESSGLRGVEGAFEALAGLPRGHRHDNPRRLQIRQQACDALKRHQKLVPR